MGFLDAAGITTLVNKLKDYFLMPSGTAAKAQAIHFGTTTSSGTSGTAFTASVSGITALTDGVTVVLLNTMASGNPSGFTLDINGLGARRVYNSMSSGLYESIFASGSVMMFVYSRSVGGWISYRGYDSDTGPIAYEVQTAESTMPAADAFVRYRILFTSADGTKWVPATTSTSTNARVVRDANTRPIDPFGRIVYYDNISSVSANAEVDPARLWQQHVLELGFSFNRAGTYLSLTNPAPVYVKCAPQADGSAIIDNTTPFVQALPSSKDGYIYIFLGRAYSLTGVELELTHPVYWHDGTGIRLWTGAEPLTLATLPIYDGTVV